MYCFIPRRLGRIGALALPLILAACANLEPGMRIDANGASVAPQPAPKILPITPALLQLQKAANAQQPLPTCCRSSCGTIPN
jgi:hypothetical protein